MKRSLGWLLAVGFGVCLLGMGCKKGDQVRSDASAPAPAAAPAGWSQVYSADFKSVQKVPAEWAAVSGEARVANGTLEVKGDGGDGQLVLKNPKCPGNVRVEVVASLVGANDEVCDLSPFINSDESGYEAGYLMQFGGGGNAENRLRRAGEVVDSTVNTKMMVKAGKKYLLVAENDGGKVRLTADGQELLSYKDASPLKGAGNGNIGFYTWGCTLRIDKIAVFTK